MATHFDTFLEYFYHREKTTPNEIYLRQPKGEQWIEYSWAEVGKQARSMVALLRARGLAPKSHIGLLSKNCAHWIIADLAILMGGYVSVPFYPNLTAQQLNEVMALSHIKALFVGKLETWVGNEHIPKSLEVITFPHYVGNAKIEGFNDWDTVVKEQEPITDAYVPSIDDLFTIIYTSGTTGTPKGVMLKYKSPKLLMENERKYGYFRLFESGKNEFFSYLPLNHIAERMIVEVASMLSGGRISFAESLDTFAKNLQDTQPTIFFAVPRIWTKFKLGILSKMPEKRLNFMLKVPVLSGIIRKKIKTGLGLSRCKTAASGAAPLPAATVDFFKKLDVHIQEVYGMTETCGGITLMPHDKFKAFTVGKPFKNCDVKIDPETGEITAKSAWNMEGYYGNPEKTAELFKDGYLHTGDRGELDSEGYLKITGRVKDTFKSAKGKYIIPAPIEWGFAKNNCIEQICVVGLGIPQPLALINLSEMGCACEKEEVIDSLLETLESVNADLPNYQKVHRIIVMEEPWTIDNGLLTPTLKIKRNVLDERFLKLYDDWYEQKERILFV